MSRPSPIRRARHLGGRLRAAIDACGFQYVRFHGLFHDDMFVYR